MNKKIGLVPLKYLTCEINLFLSFIEEKDRTKSSVLF